MLRTLSMTAAVLVLAAGAVAGPLNPPAGAVSSSYKTLGEVEPRIALSQATAPGDADSVFKITQPGSYYLTGPITGAAGKHAIQVDANDVSIDLNGFTVRGVTGALSGIVDRVDDALGTIKNLKVINGTIAEFPVRGIYCEYTTSGLIENLTVRSCGGGGVTFNGVLTARSSQFLNNSGGVGLNVGFAGTISDCVARGNQTGFAVQGVTATNCEAYGNSVGWTVSTSTLRQCTALSSGSKGFALGVSSVLEGCTVDGSSTGIEVYGAYVVVRDSNIANCSLEGILVEFSGARVVGNSITRVVNAAGSYGIGIRLGTNITNTLVERNLVTNSYFGIVVSGTNNTLIGNRVGASVASNVSLYQIPANNRFGPLVKVGTNPSTVSVQATSSTVAGTVTTTDPTANLFW